MEIGGKSTEQTHQIGGNPFDPANDDGYRHWRDHKLAAPSGPPDDLVVEIRDLEHPTTTERMALLERIRRANMALYHCKLTEHRGAVLSFAEHFGLFHLDRNPVAADDGLSAIQVHAERQQGEFIPYTERALRWHTDGYYNPPERRIHAFILHCVRPAGEGGVNRLLDPELLYLRLRDEDPDLIAALMHPAAMMIPAHIENGIELRPEQCGPVFSVHQAGGRPTLHLRYTARAHSIRWRDDAATRTAVARLETLLADPVPGAFEYRLEAGEGILCNNVLHSRSAFQDGTPDGRLLYRARFHERIAQT